MFFNAQSINNKISKLIQMLEDNSISICCICETWLQSQNNPITSYISESGYKIHHCNRTEKTGGGVAVVSKSEFSQKYARSFNYSSFECVIQTLKTDKSSVNVTLMVIYRLDSVPSSVFMDEFYECVEYAKLNFKYLVICGDFNLHVNKPNDRDTIKFMNILDTFSLKQAINSSTHKLGNTLDLLIYDPDFVTIKDIVVDSVDNLGSDHSIVYFKLFYNIQASKREEISYRNYKDMDMHQFQSDIGEVTNNFISEAHGDNFMDAVDLYSDMYESIVNRHAPLVTKVVNTCNRPPWMDSEFVDARKRRRQLYKKWLKGKTDENRTNFEESRAAVDVMARDKRRAYYQNSIKSASNSQKELFRVFNILLDAGNKSQLPYTENYDVLASRFNNYFVEKIENIRLKLGSTYSANIVREPNNNLVKLDSFELVSVPYILKQVAGMKIKTSKSDPIPAFLLKTCVHLMVPAIVHLINMSLHMGSMDGLKASIVTPILKKAGLDQDLLSNYRPVCSGLFVDKIIQKNVAEQLFQHMTRNDLHNSYQSAYKPNHSCETVLLALTNEILLNLDNGLCSVLMLLDNSAAFDTVDHDVLVSDLENDIGVEGIALDWFKSFLAGRTQATSVRGSTSEASNMKYGVPQGSVLGPVLFNIYVRNFIKLLRDAGFTVHGYADDHQTITTFRVVFQYSALCHTLPKLLNITSQWMGSRFLKLNASKTKLLIFSPKNVTDKIYIDKVYCGNNVFLPVTFQELSLGVKLDSVLSFSPQIDMVLRQSYRYISDLSRIRRFLTSDDLRSLVQAVITSRIDNCNSLFYGIQESELIRLQRLQNSCARLIYGRRKYDHVSDLFHELHWLPIRQRIVFKLLLFVFKIFNGIAPCYLATCVTIIDQNLRILKIPRSFSSYGDRAFSNVAPRLWNALPLDLRMSETVDYFKAHVKHLLFSEFTLYANKVNRYRSILNF